MTYNSSIFSATNRSKFYSSDKPLREDTMSNFLLYLHSVQLACQPASQQCFSLTQNQHQPPATSHPAVLFSYNKSTPATRHSQLNSTAIVRSPSSPPVAPYLCSTLAQPRLAPGSSLTRSSEPCTHQGVRWLPSACAG